MALLQYRPIDAPDFSTALRALSLSGASFGDALGSAQKTLGLFQNQQTQAADQEVLMRALRQQSADGLSGSLADGSLLSGLNPNRISAGVLAGLQGQVGTRLDQDRTRQALTQGALTLDQGRYNFDRLQDTNTRSDAARTAIAEIADASARGNPAEVQQLRTQYADVLGNLDADQSLGLAKDSLGLLSGELRNRTGEFDLGKNRYNLSIDQRDDRETRLAKTTALDVLRRSAGPEDARASLEGMSGLDPNVRAMATNLVQAAFPGTYGPLGSGAAPAAGGRGAPSSGGGQPVSAGVSGIPFTETRDYVTKILSNAPALSGSNREKAQQLLPALIQQESGGRDDAVSNKGARGRTQVMPATGADPGFGVKPMQNQTPQEYERFATDYLTAMLDRYDGDPEAALAAYNAGARRVDEWQKSGVALTPSQRQRTNTSATEVLTRAMQDSSTGIVNDFAGTVGDTRTPAQVAAELTGEGGELAGTNRGVVIDEINKIMQSPGVNVNAATAAAIVRRNISRADDDGGLPSLRKQARWARNILTGNIDTPNLAGGVRLNTQGIRSDVENFRNGSLLSELERGQTQAGVVNSLTKAQEQYDTAAAELVQIGNLVKTQPGLAARLPAYEAKATAALARLEGLRAAQNASPALRPEFVRTQPVATSRGGNSMTPTEILQRGATVPSLENMTPMEQSLYQQGLLPDSYFQNQ